MYNYNYIQDQNFRKKRPGQGWHTTWHHFQFSVTETGGSLALARSPVAGEFYIQASENFEPLAQVGYM